MPLWASLENLAEPVARLCRLLRAQRLLKRQEGTVRALVAQKPGTDPARVVNDAAEAPRLLTPQEVTALIDAYKSGVGVCELAATFEISRHTVARHLERGEVAKRPTVKMNPAATARARGLYESGMTVKEVGRELGIGQSTIWKALKRAGTEMRPQAPRSSRLLE